MAFRALSGVLEMNLGKPVYLDHQASTPLAPGVLDAMLPYFEGHAANPHSTHLPGIFAQKAIEDARAAIADLVGADASEIFFTSGATEANNLALLGVCARRNPSALITSHLEHKCILASARWLSSRGHEVEFVAEDREGYVDLDDLERKIKTNRPNLVSIMLANNEVGTIQDIRKIASICKQYDVLLHTDIAQGITNSEVKLDEIGVAFASLSAHKINGPKGVGAIYISREAREYISPIIHGGDQEGGLRSGTLPTPLCVGFGKAAEYWSKNGILLRERFANHRNQLWAELLDSLQDINLIGPRLDRRHVANLNVHFVDVDAELLLAQLSANIAASTGSACTSGFPEPSHVVSQLTPEAIHDGTVRFSVGLGLDNEAISYAAKVIIGAVQNLRSL